MYMDGIYAFSYIFPGPSVYLDVCKAKGSGMYRVYAIRFL